MKLVSRFAPFISESQRLTTLAGPLILSSLVSMSVSIIDLTMMAWLGPQSLAAGAVASDFFSVFFYFFVGILAAAPALLSHARGARDIAAFRGITQSGFALTIVFGVIGFCIMRHSDEGLRLVGIDEQLINLGLPYAHMMGWTFIVMLGTNMLHYYLCAHGNTKAIFQASLFAMPINALGNYLLMFGNFGFPEMGLAGAGLASILAALSMFVYLAFSATRIHKDSGYNLPRSIRWHSQSIKEILRIGLPIGVSNLGEMGVFLLVTILMARFGAEAVAAHVVALRLAGVIYAVPMGFAQAATVRIGVALGSEQKEKMLITFKTALGISMLVGLTYLVLISFFRQEVALLFLDPQQSNGDMLAQASLFLLILAVAQPLDCIGTVGSGILRGFKDTRSVMIISLIVFWGIGFGGGLGLAFYLELAGTGLWLSLAAASIGYGLLVSLRLHWCFRQVTVKPVTTASNRKMGTDHGLCF